MASVMGRSEAIVSAALVGSSRAIVEEALPATTPEGRLVGALGAASAEQRLLLAAGSRAIYRLAGFAPERIDVPPAPAPIESKTICPPGATALMHELLPSGDAYLQLEALQRMIAAGMVLPPETLPLALDSATAAQQPLVAQAVGERGAWLGRFNDEWRWASDELKHQIEDIPANADAIWRDGSSADRLQTLAYWRASDPEQARDAVMAIWRQTKADFRSRMLATLAPTWSDVVATDEPLLEMALDDRSGSVRNLAQRSLAYIPGSAYRQRAIARADALVSMGRKKLSVTAPEAYEKSWERDGIERKARQGTDEPAWWLTQIIALTPPDHWVERFGRTPADLLAAAPDSHFVEFMEGLADAVMRYQAEDWAPALLELWRQRPDRRSKLEHIPTFFTPLRFLPRQELEAIALRALREGESKHDVPWRYVVGALPRPWGAEVARAWIAALREHASNLSAAKQPYHELTMVGGDRVLALPRELLDEALAPWDIDTSVSTYQAMTWREHLDTFLKLVRLCQRIYDEIPGA